MKKRYAVGFYNNEERLNNPEWMKYRANRLIAFIYDNQEMFDIKYISHDKDKNRAWIVLDTQELNKAKEGFSHEETNEVVEYIDICNDYDKWKTSCTCCDSITINAIPYTYREFGGCVGREYNCLLCSGLNNRMAHLVSEEQKNNGTEKAMNLLIDICEDKYVDEESKYYCDCCDRDVRCVGIVKDSETIYTPSHEGKFIELSVEDYNKREEEFDKEVEGYYGNYYALKDKLEGYSCFECGCKVDEEVVEEILANTI